MLKQSRKIYTIVQIISGVSSRGSFPGGSKTKGQELFRHC